MSAIQSTSQRSLLLVLSMLQKSGTTAAIPRRVGLQRIFTTVARGVAIDGVVHARILLNVGKARKSGPPTADRQDNRRNVRRAIAKAQSDELIARAEEKGSAYWKTSGMLRRAGVLASAGKASNAVGIFTAAIPVWRSIGSRVYLPVWLSLLARAYGELGQFDDAWSHIGEAMTTVETTKEKWYDAEPRYRLVLPPMAQGDTKPACLLPQRSDSSLCKLSDFRYWRSRFGVRA